MKFTDLVGALGRPIVYYPELTHVTGSLTAGVFICNLVQWTGAQKDPHGWIYKTQDEIRAETGLSRREQEMARKVLRDIGMLQEQKRGVPARLYYRANLDAINAAIENHLADKDGGNRHTGVAESANQERTEPPSLSGGNRHAIPVLTTDETQEETQEEPAPNLKRIQEWSQRHPHKRSR